VAERAAVKATRVVRAAVPLAVTLGVFWWISRRVEWADVFAHIHADTLRLLIPALAAWAALSLGLDAVSLVRSSPAGANASLLGMARLKAATYPLGIVHYALGGAALVVLLRRRARYPLAEATGVVMLMTAFDLLATLLFAALAGAWLATDAASVRAAVLAAAIVGAPLGLFLLRTERPLGRLERVRNLRLLRAARELPTARLLELFALRALFVVVFIALGGAALVSFGIRPPLGTLVAGFPQVALVAALPIAVAGLGTSQAAFLYVFRSLAPADELLACSVALSAGMIAVRFALGALFAREFSLPAAPEGAEERA
jgi:hypothetical protein